MDNKDRTESGVHETSNKAPLMVNKSKEKGTRWESAVAKYLRSKGFDVWRMAQTGTEDQGDIGGLSQVAFECRNRAKISLAENVDDAESRAKYKEADYGVAVIKRRGKGTADAYVAMTLETFTRLMKEAGLE